MIHFCQLQLGIRFCIPGFSSWFHLGYGGGGSRGLEECLISPEEGVCPEVGMATSPGFCGMDAHSQIMLFPTPTPTPPGTAPFLPSFPRLFGIQCFVLVCWLYPASLPWTPLILFSFPKLNCSESSERESQATKHCPWTCIFI